MTKADDILAFFCVSAFFAGLIIAVATLDEGRKTPIPRPRLYPAVPAWLAEPVGKNRLPNGRPGKPATDGLERQLARGSVKGCAANCQLYDC
jgi:hypothetical protein